MVSSGDFVKVEWLARRLKVTAAVFSVVVGDDKLQFWQAEIDPTSSDRKGKEKRGPTHAQVTSHSHSKPLIYRTSSLGSDTPCT